MPIATLDAYKAAFADGRQIVPLTVGAFTTLAGRLYDLWTAAPPVGAAPTAAVVPTRATIGALGQENAGAGLNTAIIGARFSALSPGNYLVIDRLSHQGGLSAIVTTAQTTNLPTAAITRGSAVGVMIGLTIYAQIGTTVTTVTVSYTNSDGTAGRTSPAVVFGGTANREAGRLIQIPLQAGDVGVQSVQSVTVLATTATAGNFGVTLFRPLYVVCVPDASGVLSAGGLITGSTFGGAPNIPADACLSLLYLGSTNPIGAGALLVHEH
jgi:hypothetical protein